MKTFFGGVFINREKLHAQGIEYPIKLEYYKTIEPDIMKKGDEKNYGVQVVKTEYQKGEVKIEKEELTYLTDDEIEANKMLDMLKQNEVTPIGLKDVIQDIFMQKIQNFN